MDKVLIEMQHITICTPCIVFMLVSHTYIFTIDHVGQGPEEPPEPIQVEDTNPEQEQGKPRWIKPSSLRFIYLLYLSYDP
jgi:hypothetical protein